jgi:hypothetical protein
VVQKTVQTNVRVAPEHRTLIYEVASRLKIDPGFADALQNLLAGTGQGALSSESTTALEDRLTTLEETVKTQRAWLTQIQQRLDAADVCGHSLIPVSER